MTIAPTTHAFTRAATFIPGHRSQAPGYLLTTQNNQDPSNYSYHGFIDGASTGTPEGDAKKAAAVSEAIALWENHGIVPSLVQQ